MGAVILAVLLTLLVCAAVILGDRTRSTQTVSRMPGWVALATGVAALIAVAVPMIVQRSTGMNDFGESILPASIGLGLCGLVTGGYALIRKDRSWPALVGLASGGLVTAFWLAFFIGELVFPH